MRKYLHVFYTETKVKFAPALINKIQSEKEYFNSDDHFFVTYSKDEYEVLKKYANVEFFEVQNNKTATVEIVNALADSYEWVFLHGLSDMVSITKIKKRHLKKIVWRTWGHDMGLDCNSGSPIKRLAKKAFNKTLFKSFVNSIRGIGIAGITDKVSLEMEISKNYKGELFRLTYLSSVTSAPADSTQAVNMEKYGLSANDLNVMIGHSAYHHDCHFEMIDKLKRFKNENIKFIFPISYGSNEDKPKIERYAIEQLGAEKVLILNSFIPAHEYNKILDHVDIAIFAGRRSYALGNIGILLDKGKTLYLRKKGILAAALKELGSPYNYIENIQNMTFEEFSTLIPNVKESRSKTPSNETYLNYWKECLASLN